MPESARRALRLWPGVIAVILQWLMRFVVPIFWPDALAIAVLSEFAFALLIIIWWAFFSRAPIVERWSAIVLIIAAMLITSRLVDRSISTGMMGLMLPVVAIPVVCLAFVAWAVATQRLSNGLRRVTMVATILLVCGGWATIRTNGLSGSASSDLTWRWAPTSEDRLLAHESVKPAAISIAPVEAKIPEVPAKAEPVAVPVASPIVTSTPKLAADWPGFRGPHRDDVVTGVRIETDWSKVPPVEMWRRPVGPGWSSFAVRGGLIYTQEQRGSDEVVACYNLTTGQPVWKHGDPARFWESNAGAGPRATPTLDNGRVYTFGATGIVNALDARTGAVVWSRNAAADTGMKTPEWGFASSPLIVGDAVIVAASGKLAAYDVATGEPRWYGPKGGVSYSSPQLATFDGVTQVLLLSDSGAVSVAPADGALLWKHPWPGYPIVQPALTADGGLLVSISESSGTRRLAAVNGPAGWTVETRWTSAGLKPYFNDFVVRNGHAFGFDGAILACIDLADGKRIWKGGHYGHGQLLLLADQDVLLVLSEEGELALVSAATDQFKELAKFPALDGKTWNHPVLAGDVLLVRNGQEMVAFRLALARS
jgi:outer membrane protein assembly factor BamB